ncbi:uncharacterized protein C8Q71DRAFT_864417 [Rhodofomes roseus]|uniref:MARVEL domain-containing protein n=1 Tax=Rhodofomes roseus TaxID=34475 RepID=A0ABQ8KWE5_9APHY|nr:uncharacterized protein C8Q71DRAFT_864417 [Rhodofomes roseus]KAH9843629.1 hypothetical protein C8Q71DRAFT_864417 [Rhodofomes roseus]
MRPASLRIPLYCVLWLFSFILLALAIARLNYTLHLPKGDPLNHGADFYDPVVVELLVDSFLAFAFVPFVFNFLDRFLNHKISKAVVEVIALAILWLLWLIGCGIATSIWPNLTFCYNFTTCRVLAAMTAFAWLGWLTICALLVVGFFSVFVKQRDSDLGSSDGMVEWARGVPAGSIP